MSWLLRRYDGARFLSPATTQEISMKNIGDKVEKFIAKPIAKVSDAVIGTNLVNCKSCKTVKQDLNEGRYGDAVYDFFHRKAANNHKENNE